MQGIADITVGECNGIMALTVTSGKYTTTPELRAGDKTIEFEYEYGESLNFTTTGKNSKYDTIVTEGEITSDKFIVLNKMNLDMIEIESWMFHKHLFDPFFSTNETKTIHIPEIGEIPMWWLELVS
jgi:hypothetical protein